MATVRFTSILVRHRPVPSIDASGATVREVLDASFADDELLRGYILDEQGRLRKHVNVYVDGTMIRDRLRLSDPVPATAEIYVLQALSGG